MRFCDRNFFLPILLLRLVLARSPTSSENESEGTQELVPIRIQDIRPWDPHHSSGMRPSRVDEPGSVLPQLNPFTRGYLHSQGPFDRSSMRVPAASEPHSVRSQGPPERSRSRSPPAHRHVSSIPRQLQSTHYKVKLLRHWKPAYDRLLQAQRAMEKDFARGHPMYTERWERRRNVAYLSYNKACQDAGAPRDLIRDAAYWHGLVVKNSPRDRIEAFNRMSLEHTRSSSGSSRSSSSQI